MPRREREISEYGIYHVMLRGVNKQIIFEDYEDNVAFISILRTYKLKCKFDLLAYCLMRNHVHILIKEGDMPLEAIFRRIGTTYAQYFNRKYSRVGHLFQDRYRSEAVKSEEQLLRTLRYIHRNPVKAGICRNMEEYAFSSYGQYVNGERGVADIEFILNSYGEAVVIEAPEEASEVDCMDIDDDIRKLVTEERAKAIYSDICNNYEVSNISLLSVKERNIAIRKLRSFGLSIRQITELTGINRTTVVRA